MFWVLVRTVIDERLEGFRCLCRNRYDAVTTALWAGQTVFVIPRVYNVYPSGMDVLPRMVKHLVALGFP